MLTMTYCVINKFLIFSFLFSDHYPQYDDKNEILYIFKKQNKEELL